LTEGWLGAARGFELIGVRAFYTFLAPPWHRVPSVKELRNGQHLSAETYRKGIRDARYYTGANFLRLLTYIPIFYGLQKVGDRLAMSMLIALSAFHIVSIFAESYKAIVLVCAKSMGRVVDDPALLPVPPEPPHPPLKGYFAPYRFESKKGYQAIAMEWFRVRVAKFVDSLSGGPSTDRGSRKGLHNFVQDTIAAEKIHWIAAILSLIMALPFYIHRDVGLAVYASSLVVLDLYLVMLQRYHRTRVWDALRLPRQN